MLTSVGRAAVRRVLTRAATPTAASVPRSLAIRSAVPSRSFVSSALARFPEKGSVTTAAKKTKTTKAKKATGTTKKKTAAAKKPKAKPKPRKVLTPEQKETLLVRQLKKEALLSSGPERVPSSAWRLFVAQKFGGTTGSFTDGRQAELAQQYKNLSASEMEVSFWPYSPPQSPSRR